MSSLKQKFNLLAKTKSGVVAVTLLLSPLSYAHHSYAMFDNTQVTEVEATIAKLEWVNPHIFLWAYVADSSQENGYQLYAFETGSMTMMTKAGWTRDDTFVVGEEVTIKYFPLFNGEAGGSLVGVTHADGSVTPGDLPALKFLERLQSAENGDAHEN